MLLTHIQMTQGQKDGQTEGQYRQNYRQTDRRTERQTEEQRDRQKDRQTQGQTDRLKFRLNLVKSLSYLFEIKYCNHRIIVVQHRIIERQNIRNWSLQSLKITAIKHVFAPVQVTYIHNKKELLFNVSSFKFYSNCSKITNKNMFLPHRTKKIRIIFCYILREFIFSGKKENI